MLITRDFEALLRGRRTVQSERPRLFALHFSTPMLGWLAAVMLVELMISVLFVTGMAALGYSEREALAATPHGQIVSLVRATQWDYDSWSPVLLATKRAAAQPGETPYAVFFEGRAKFQYPPAALWLAAALPAEVVDEALLQWDGSRLQYWNRWLMAGALAVTLVLSSMIVVATTQQVGGTVTPATIGLILTATAAAGLTFFPLLVSYQLGQIQTVLNAIIAAAVLFFIKGRMVPSGICIGLCCLIKPQYAVVLLWSAVRRRSAFAKGILVTVVPALAASVLWFGLASHLDYVRVLRVLAQRGEAFWYNQSLSGLLHRFIDPGSAVFFNELGAPLPPFRAPVYLASLTCTLAVLALALSGSRRPGVTPRVVGTVDFCVALVAATVASPIAWNHHYGAMFPVFAAVAPILLKTAGKSRLAALLGFSYVAVGYVVAWPGPFFLSRWSGLLQSHAFVGGLTLFAILVVFRRSVVRGDATGSTLLNRSLPSVNGVASLA